MKKICLIFLIIIFFGVLKVLADTVSFEKLLNELSTKEKNTQTLSFKFSQSIKIISTQEETKIEGEVFFKKEKKFFVKNTKPFKQIIVTNGSTLWIFNPTINQVIVKKTDYFFEQDNFMYFFNFVFDFEKWEEQYEVAFLLEQKDIFVLAMKPKQIKDMNIYIHIFKDTFFPNLIKIKDSEFEIVTIIYKVEYNKNIDDKKFEFVIPNKAEVFYVEE